MVTYLIDGGDDLSVFEEDLQVVDLEVANADTPARR